MYSIPKIRQLALALAACLLSQQDASAAQGAAPFTQWTVPVTDAGQPTAFFTPSRRLALSRPTGGCTVVGKFSSSTITMVGLDAGGTEAFRVEAPAQTQTPNEENFVGGLVDGSVIVVEKSPALIRVRRWDEMGVQLPTIEAVPPQGHSISGSIALDFTRGRYVGLMADGGLAVVSVTIPSSQSTELTTWRFEPDGQLRYLTQVPEPLGASNLIYPLVPQKMNDSVVVSTIVRASTGSNIMLTKLGSQGALLWNQELVNSYTGLGGMIPAINAGDDVAVSGNRLGTRVFRFDSQGQLLGIPVNGMGAGRDVSLRDDRSFTTGAYGYGSSTQYLASFDPQGNLRWASPGLANRRWLGPTTNEIELVYELIPQRLLTALNPDGSERWSLDYSGYLVPSRWTDVFPDDALYLLSEPLAGGGILVRKINTAASVSASDCAPMTLNSAGSIGRLSCVGSTDLLRNDLVLLARNLPPGAFCLFLGSAQPLTSPLPIPSSVGSLCLGAPFARFVAPGQVKTAGPGGMVSLTLDLNALPLGAGTVPAMPGDTWSFQAWYRDGSNLSNLTETATITF